MDPLDTLRSVVILLHLAGFAVLFGAWVVEAVGRRRVTRVMHYGLALALVAGLALAAPWPAGIELNYPKMGVKLVVVIAVGGLLGAAAARQRRSDSVPPVLFWLIGALTLANAAIAVLWR